MRSDSDRSRPHSAGVAARPPGHHFAAGGLPPVGQAGADDDARSQERFSSRDEMVFLAMLSEAALERGDLSEAASLALAALEHESCAGGEIVIGPHYVWGAILLERNELSAALVALEIARERADAHGLPCCRALVLLALARALRASRRGEVARAMLRDAAANITGPGDPVWYWVLHQRAVYALADEDFVAAQEAIDGLEEPSRSRLAASLLARQGQTEAALAALDRVRPDTTRELLHDLLVRGRCARGADRLALVRETIQLAEGDRYLRTFVDQGSWIVPTLRSLGSSWPSSYPDDLVELIERPSGRDGRGPGAEDLTPRERDVLRYLGTRLSIPEIAGELLISRNTVKSHVQRIYQKLGVRTRAEADAIWRRSDFQDSA